MLARKGPVAQWCKPCYAEDVQERYWREKAPPDKLTLICPDCGRTIALRRTQHMRRWCQPCSDRRRAGQIAAWIKRHPEYRRELLRQKGYRRQARQRGVGYERFSRREIFGRDRWRCQICLKRINQRLQYPHPMSASLDHVIPLSQGGPHSRANVRASHLRCNTLRNDKGGNEQLALIG
jgi:hypothetical protein